MHRISRLYTTSINVHRIAETVSWYTENVHRIAETVSWYTENDSFTYMFKSILAPAHICTFIITMYIDIQKLPWNDINIYMTNDVQGNFAERNIC